MDGRFDQCGPRRPTRDHPLPPLNANTGIGTIGTKLHKIREDIWQETMDVNLGGVWKSVKAGVPHLLAGGRGGSTS